MDPSIVIKKDEYDGKTDAYQNTVVVIVEDKEFKLIGLHQNDDNILSLVRMIRTLIGNDSLPIMNSCGENIVIYD